MFRTLNRLGVSPAESFFYETRVFVEGPDDEELLEEGFRSTIGDRCQISSLGGRKAIEAEIQNLQKAEKEAKLDRLHCFIFDKDRDVTSLTSTTLVRVLQWDRYCFENYLLNVQILYDVLKEASKDDFPDRGAFRSKVTELAIRQIKPLVARKVFEQSRPMTTGLTQADLRDSYEEMAEVLSDQMKSLQKELNSQNLDEWRKQYLSDTKSSHAEYEREWSATWEIESDGKSLIEALCREYSIKRDRRELKKELVRGIREQKTPEWNMVVQLLSNAVKRP